MTVSNALAAHSNPAQAEALETIYCLGDLWYFRDGRGEEIGPFRYRCEAESGLQRFRELAAESV